MKGPDGRVSSYADTDPTIEWAGPLVGLTSRFSASARRFSPGIQDYHRGLIVGDRSTHGKGTVESLIPIGSRLFSFSRFPIGALKLTISSSIAPRRQHAETRRRLDVVFPWYPSCFAEGESELEYPVAFDRVEPQSYKRFNDVSPPVVDQLRHLSEQRCAASEKFRKGRPQHRPLQRAEGEEVSNAQRSEVPQGVGGPRRGQRRGKGDGQAERREHGRSSETSILTRFSPSPPTTSTA